MLVANCGQGDKLVVQTAVTEISDLWENTENACKARKNDLAEVFKLAEQFEKSHAAASEWLDVTEKKLEKVPSVGSDAKAVKKQLDALRVRNYMCSNTIKIGLLYFFILGLKNIDAIRCESKCKIPNQSKC